VDHGAQRAAGDHVEFAVAHADRRVGELGDAGHDEQRRRALEDAPELRPFLFYAIGDGLERVSDS
jgi:hypothetical protein